MKEPFYKDLFGVIGEKYGPGDGSTTFTLPDLRGEFLRGVDLGRGVDEGREVGTNQGDAIREMTGNLLPLARSYANGGGGLSAQGNGIFVTRRAETASGIDVLTASMVHKVMADRVDFKASAQVPTAHENRPRNVAMLACIKY